MAALFTNHALHTPNTIHQSQQRTLLNKTIFISCTVPHPLYHGFHSLGSEFLCLKVRLSVLYFLSCHVSIFIQASLFRSMAPRLFLIAMCSSININSISFPSLPYVWVVFTLASFTLASSAINSTEFYDFSIFAFNAFSAKPIISRKKF